MTKRRNALPDKLVLAAMNRRYRVSVLTSLGRPTQYLTFQRTFRSRSNTATPTKPQLTASPIVQNHGIPAE